MDDDRRGEIGRPHCVIFREHLLHYYYTYLPSYSYVRLGTVGFTKKRGCRRVFNSYVPSTIRFANRNSLDMGPPLACRDFTMVKFRTKNGDDGLLQSTSEHGMYCFFPYYIDSRFYVKTGVFGI